MILGGDIGWECNVCMQFYGVTLILPLTLPEVTLIFKILSGLSETIRCRKLKLGRHWSGDIDVQHYGVTLT